MRYRVDRRTTELVDGFDRADLRETRAAFTIFTQSELKMTKRNPRERKSERENEDQIEK